MAKQILTIHQKNLNHQLIELAQIAQIEQQQFAHDAWQITTLQDLFKQNIHQIAYLQSNQQVICYCIYQQIFENAEILRIATHHYHQKQGLASHLLQQILNNLSQHAITQVLLEVRDDNQTAIKLYQKLGFGQIATRKHYYQNPDKSFCDAIIMQKLLN